MLTIFTPSCAGEVQTAAPATSTMSDLTSAEPPVPVKLSGWVVPMLAPIVVTGDVDTELMAVTLTGAGLTVLPGAVPMILYVIVPDGVTVQASTVAVSVEFTKPVIRRDCQYP